MIKSFKSKDLARLWNRGVARKIDSNMRRRILRRLEVLDKAERLQDLSLPGFDFHALHGFKPRRFSIHVNGPWCITFEFEDGDARRIDFEQYH